MLTYRRLIHNNSYPQDIVSKPFVLQWYIQTNNYYPVKRKIEFVKS